VNENFVTAKYKTCG